VAQTWRITPLKVGVFRLIDFVGRPFKGMFRSPRPLTDEIRNVLVIEPWQIGDVVLATPILRALRARYPAARITVLGKPHAEELLRHSGLVDEVIVFDIPWTAKTRKYDPARYERGQLRELIAKLRARQFDLTLDARMDLRSNILTYLSHAPRRVGFDFGGGAFLLTDAVPAQPDEKHRVDDWLDLMRPLAGESAPLWENVEPMLRVSDAESEAAAATLRKAGIGPDDVVVAIHGGASDPRRMWPAESFERIAERLRVESGVKTVFFLEPAAADRDIPGALVLRTSLREMMAVLSHCDLFLCNDSGPMHIADALGVPVVAVFLTGNPVWHRPYRSDQIVVGAGTGHDFLVAPTEDEILAAAKKQLAR
jgi:ADP-heptose:LPS heptosyltransferase